MAETPERSRGGFRCSTSDTIVLLLAGALMASTWRPMPLAAAAVAMVVGHFFLFCNVLRVPRWLELSWAATFVANVLGQILLDVATPGTVLAVQAPFTAVVVVLTFRRRDYHGIGWQRIRVLRRTYRDEPEP